MCCMLKNIGAFGIQWLFIHPADDAFQLVGDLGQIMPAHDHITAADVDLIGEGQNHRVAGGGFGQVAAIGCNRLNVAGAPRGQDHNFLAWHNTAGGNLPGKTTEILVGTDDQLHREAKIDQIAASADVDIFQMVEQGRAFIPGHIRTFVNHVVASQR